MVIKLIRWLKGYVQFVGVGKFPERFINLLNHNGILYWDLYPTQGGITGAMPIYNYLRIRKYANRASIKLKVTKKKGLPIFINKHKNRKGILIGAVCAVVIMAILNQFVWVVNINGLNNLSYAQVKATIEDCGLKVGVYKNKLDISQVERNVILNMPEIGWISINCINNIATVEIKEKSEKPPIEDTSYPCNLVATTDGVITKTVVSNGDCKVLTGSAVAEGQLLISGIKEQVDESINYVHSQGEVYADVQKTKSISISSDSKIIIPNENYSKKTNLQFLWLTLPFEVSWQGDSGINTYHNQYLQINDVVLPLGVNTQRCYNYDKGQINEKGVNDILLKKYNLYECFNESCANVKSRNIKFSQKGNIYTINVDYVVNENIVKEQIIEING